MKITSRTVFECDRNGRVLFHESVAWWPNAMMVANYTPCMLARERRIARLMKRRFGTKVPTSLDLALREGRVTDGEDTAAKITITDVRGTAPYEQMAGFLNALYV